MKRFFIDIVWQLPQNILGIIFGLFVKKEVYHNHNYDDCVIYKTNSKGGITLGCFIYINKDIPSFQYIIKHEHGHVVQSQILGPLYLLVIGLPSLIWSCVYKLFKNKSYYSFYTERWANKISDLKWK